MRIAVCLSAFLICSASISAQWVDKGWYKEVKTDIFARYTRRVVVSTEKQRICTSEEYSSYLGAINVFNLATGKLVVKKIIQSDDYYQLYAIDVSQDALSYCVHGSLKSDNEPNTIFAYVFDIDTDTLLLRYTDSNIGEKYQSDGETQMRPAASYMDYDKRHRRFTYGVNTHYLKVYNGGQINADWGESGFADFAANGSRIHFVEYRSGASAQVLTSEDRSKALFSAAFTNNYDKTLTWYYLDDANFLHKLDSVSDQTDIKSNATLAQDASTAFWVTHLNSKYRLHHFDKQLGFTQQSTLLDRQVTFISGDPSLNYLSVGTSSFVYFYDRSLHQLDSLPCTFAKGDFVFSTSSDRKQNVFLCSDSFLRLVDFKYEHLIAAADVQPAVDLESILQVTPVPADHMLRIQCKGSEIANAHISLRCAIDGKVAYSGAAMSLCSASECQIDLSSVPPGEYLLVVQTAEQIFTKTILVAR